MAITKKVKGKWKAVTSFKDISCGKKYNYTWSITKGATYRMYGVNNTSKTIKGKVTVKGVN